MSEDLRKWGGPSLTAPILALFTTLAILQWSGEVLRSEAAGWDMSTRFVDDASYVEQVVRQFHPSARSVVFLGGSVTREGVTGDHDLEGLLRGAGAGELSVRNLGWSSFSPVEAIAVADTLDVPRGSLMVLQLSWQNLVESRADLDKLVRRPRLADLRWDAVLDFASPEVRFEVAVTPWLIRHSAIIANYLQQRSCDWYKLQHVSERARCLRPLHVQRNYYAVETRQSAREKAASSAVAHSELRLAADLNHRFAETVYRRFIERVASRGFHAVLILFPRDAAESEAMARNGLDILEQEVMLRLSRGSEVIDLRSVGGLQREDFADPLHLLDSGRKKVSVELARQIAVVIAKEGRGTGQ